MAVETPSLSVSIGGVPVPGVVALETEAVAYFAADRFDISIAIGAVPATDAAYFCGLGLQTITIGLSLGGLGVTPLLTGQVDAVRLDLLRQTARLTGRDLSARLIDAEISETFVNQTASQIAVVLAGRHNLSANVTATSVPVGQYYELDHARTGLGLNARATTEWNLLTALAQAENFNVSVTGTALNFGPPPGVNAVVVTPANFMSLALDVGAALPGQANVKSWNTRNKRVVSASAGNGLATTLIRPNLSPQQAAALAQNHLAALGWHGTTLMGTMPGDATLMPGMQMVLSGTDTVFDQNYTVAEVSRALDVARGFTQSVRAYAID